MPDVIVVGAGVIGLSVADRLLAAGRTVELRAAKPPARTTSGVAAAIWYPYRAEPRERVLAWGARSVAVFTDLAADPATGVAMRSCLELLPAPAASPWWRDAVPSFAPADASDLPDGFAAGWRVTLPVVEMPVYLEWLAGRVAGGGARLVPGRVDDLGALTGETDAVVNCTGLGARDLVGDDTLYPVRGQVVVVRNPGIEEAVLAQADPVAPTYVVPRRDDVVLGGTAEVGRWDLEPDAATAEGILARATALQPHLADAPVLAHRVGLRPARPAVRLETEPLGSATLAHCYGHGGAGVTLSWGCAEEVAALLDI